MEKSISPQTRANIISPHKVSKLKFQLYQKLIDWHAGSTTACGCYCHRGCQELQTLVGGPRRENDLLPQFHAHVYKHAQRYRAINNYILDYCWGTSCATQPLGCSEHLAGSLETKWGDIKFATINFVGVHNVIVALNKSKKSDDNSSNNLYSSSMNNPFRDWIFFIVKMP